MSSAARRGRRAAAALAAIALAGCGAAAPPPPETRADTLLARIAGPIDGGEVALVRVVVRGGEHAFDPAQVTVRPGDVVRFVLAGSEPESVAFDTAGASPEAAEFLRARGLLFGTLLTRPGEVHEASFRGAPPGRYPFHSVPHAALGMRGAVVVEGGG